MRLLKNAQDIKRVIENRWPKFNVKLFDEKNEQVFILDFGNDYTKLFLCIGNLKQEDGEIFVFISTGNDEIKDTTIYKKYFNFENGSDEENVFRVLEFVLKEYTKKEHLEWKENNDILAVYGLPDPCEGSYGHQIVENITGISF